MLELLGAIGGIVLVDLVLSGDNALVIGAAAAGLPRRQRLFAITFGGAAAILLRIAFATVATLVLRLPLVQTIGGLALIVIAVRLLMGRDDSAHAPDDPAVEGSRHTPLRKGLGGALLTIVVADVTMSLDNVVAVAALAHGNIPILAAGLLLSIALLLVGSALIAELIGRMPWLLDVAALVLGWTAAHMILGDERVVPILAHVPLYDVLLPIALLGVVLAADIWLRARSATTR
jgi:YjbE family integral membrane protein